MHLLIVLSLFFRQNPFCQSSQITAKRNQQQGCRNIEQCVHIGNLGCWVPRRKILDHMCQREENADDCKNNSTYDVEHQMDNRRTFCISAGSDRC